MIRIHNLRVEIKEHIDLYDVVSKKLKIKREKIKDLKIHKRSIDARNKKTFSFVYDIDVSMDNENKYLNNFITKVEEEKYIIPNMGDEILHNRPVIIGAGPAGLFCAYELAKYGYKPIIIERGEKIENRIKTVDKLWQNGIFNKNSNVQFGEGGAGTFSDGKLNTLVKDKNNRMKEVFEVFVNCGAPKEIMYDSKPHIGTDVLRKVIVNLRNKILSLGGEIRYNSLMEDIIIENGNVVGIIVNGELLSTDVLVLAIGHSSRDTFRLLNEKNVVLESKPFAVGVRIIHSQEMINENQYPINYPFLPPASYKLTYQTKAGRGVYSFCMCPGGYVVDARSTEKGIVVNGMSNYKRESKYANSAIVVTVGPKDYGMDILDGVKFQEQIEAKAWTLTNGVLSVQKYGDYKAKILSPNFSVHGIKGKYESVDINEIFPKCINESLIEGIEYFGNKIKDFNCDEAIIVAPEARTSSPIRIIRDEKLESSVKGIYPAGEGAGYAGGITTSAMDGLKVFEEILKKYKNK